LCTANFVLAFFILPETLRPSSEHVPARPHWNQWAHTLKTPRISLLVVIFFLATFCFACFETTLPLLLSHLLHLDYKSDDHAKAVVGYMFAYSGIIGALVQGGAIGRLVKMLGEPKLIALSLVIVAASLAPMPYIHGWTSVLVALGLLAIGTSLTRPPVFGMLSNLAPAGEQGATIGVAQSAGSLARIVGPIFAASLFDYSPALPYLICAGISLVAGVITWQLLCRQKTPTWNSEETQRA
jgi:DHA1 family tetracycline resistance protein-like MFS transporter